MARSRTVVKGPSLREMLADPTIRAVTARDGVAEQELFAASPKTLEARIFGGGRRKRTPILSAVNR